MSSAADIRHAEKWDQLKSFGDLAMRVANPHAYEEKLDLATLIRKLDRLKNDEGRDRVADLSRKHDRLAAAYALGMRLRDDDDLRNQFFSAPHWKEFDGHKPKLGKHGREDAVHFAVMHVFGGPENRREASLFARASTFLAQKDVQPDGFVDALTTTPGKDGRLGPRALAELARAEERSRSSGSSPKGESVRTRLIGSVGNLRISTSLDFPEVLAGDIYLHVVDGCLTVSSDPEEFVPFHVLKPESVPAAA